MICVCPLVLEGIRIKRAPMSITDQTRSSRDSDACFPIGKYLVSVSRTCEEARAQLGLSNRELELLTWVGKGLTKKDIAAQMGISPSTADTFRRRAYAKLGVGTGAAAIAILSAFLAGGKVEFGDTGSTA